MFRPGKDERVVVSDCAKIYLEPNEQVSFVTASGREHDFTAKSWGFYSTPSVNGRLVKEGFKTALVENQQGKFYIMVVDKDRLDDFHTYLDNSQNQVVEWLDER